MITEEIRSYEVSVWTLQDEFISVLKWSNVENKGTIQDPKMTIADDGTQSLTFTIPMYLYENGQFVENPIWYNTRNGNLMVSMRKIKVIFNKESYKSMNGIYDPDLAQKKKIFEFIITKITEEHESDHLFCNVECEGLAFHELGKIGYTYDLSQADIEYDYKTYQTDGHWETKSGIIKYTMPRATIDYWCDKIDLDKCPNSESNMEPRKWYYKVEMDWSSYSDYYSDQQHRRQADIIYEDEHATAWIYDQSTNDLVPTAIEGSREKERIIDTRESNLYNITQTIAEMFEVFCRYDYKYDNNNRIIGRVVVFFNNYIHDNNKDIISLTYPYSSSKISREMDSQNLVTKLYVKSMQDDTTYLGEASIRYCDANKMQEDYIFNFEYMKEVGAINEEQYEAIKQYEIDMFQSNTALYPLEEQINFYSNKITELEAKKTVYENSVKLDQEQKDSNDGLRSELMKKYGTGDNSNTIEGHNENNPELGIISKDEQDNPCIKLGTKEKGIHADTVKIYRKYDSSNHSLTGEVTGFSFTYDEYNNPTAIYGVAADTDTTNPQPNTVYMTYNYEPLLYYDAIVKSWEEKLHTDEKHLNDVMLELGTEERLTEQGNVTSPIYEYFAPLLGISAGFIGASSSDKERVKAVYVGCLKHLLDQIQEEYDKKLEDKQSIITEFNQMMGSALREGYWQPEDYQDYGEYHQQVRAFEGTYNQSSSNMTQEDLDDGFVVAWDTDLFDEEQDIYYETGVNQTKVYYPCVNISSLLSDTDFKKEPEKYSFVFNNNYYDESANPQLITNVRSFAIGSEAILSFVKNNSGNIYPALILVGAKNMTDANDENPIVTGGTIGFMKDPTRGHPRISKLTAPDVNGGQINITEPAGTRHDLTTSDFTFGGSEIENCTVVMPRIRFTSLMLKTNTSDLYIKYPYNADTDPNLEDYKDYYIRNRRNTHNYKPEYLITLKPATMIKGGTLTGNVCVNYALSNAGTAIYLDAQKIAQENAFPKVSYTIDTNILNKEFVSTLYNKLNWLVMINDAQLKFENTFGYISKLELDLDRPENDSIEIKNYKTKFEDLFSNIVATTEALQQGGSRLAAAAGGNIALSEEGFEQTITNNQNIFNAYIDSHFDGPNVVTEVITELVDELGMILGCANKTLSSMNALSIKNAGILGGFAQAVQDELTVKVVTSPTKPSSFKPGDIWIQTDENTGEVVGKYVSTYLSSEIDQDRNGFGGFVRTYDGTLASITGAGMDINADTGEVDIYAANELTLRSGNHVYIAANDAIDIVGNKSVNIGGATINIAADSSEDTVFGGINLVATAIDMSGYKNQPNKSDFPNWETNHYYEVNDYVKFGGDYWICNTAHDSGSTPNTLFWDTYDTIEDAIAEAIGNSDGTIAKVLIRPTKIEMGAADILMRGNQKIEMITSHGDSDNTSAISISPSNGVYIGSGKGISLFSGKVAVTNGNIVYKNENNDVIGASVELNSEHLILGFSNTINNANTAIEMTDEQMIIAAGGALSQEPFEANHGYQVGDTIIYNNKHYKCKTAHTSDSTPNSSYWKELEITGTSGGLVGALFKKDSIGFAVETQSNGIQGILMNDKGVTIGGGNIDVTLPTTGNNGNNLRATSGSYVRISSDGIELGSLADLYVNMNNFKLQTDILTGDSEATTRFAIGRNLQNIDSTTANGLGSSFIGLVYNKTGLFVNGIVNASAFVASCNKGYFKATGNDLGFYNTSGNAVMTLSGSAMTVNGSFDITADNILIDSDATSTNPVFKLRKKESNNSYTDYLAYKANGVLEIKGAITATAFTLDPNCNKISADMIASGVIPDPDDFGVDGIGWQSWQGSKYVSLTARANGNGANDGDPCAGILIGYSDSTQHLIVPYSASSDKKVVDISREGILFDTYTMINSTLTNTAYIHMNASGIEVQGDHISINGKDCWNRGDILYGETRPAAPNGASEWIWIQPNKFSQWTYNLNNSVGSSNDMATATASNTISTPITDGTGTSYTYTVTFSIIPVSSNAQNWAIKVQLLSNDENRVIDMGTTGIENIPANGRAFTFSISLNANNAEHDTRSYNVCNTNNTKVRVGLYSTSNGKWGAEAGYNSTGFSISNINLLAGATIAQGGIYPCTVYYIQES